MSDASSQSISLVAGIVLAALSTFALLWLIPANVATGSSAGDLPPNTVPNLSAGLVLLLSLALIIQSLLRRKRQGKRTGGRHILAELTTAAAVFGGVWLAFIKPGFLVMSIPFMSAAMLYAGGRNLWIIAVISVVLSVIIYFGVWEIFTVQLP